MISKKAIIVWVFSAVVGVGMLASPRRALAHDHDGDGNGGGGHHQQWHHDNGQHRGWFNHQNNDGDENPGYNQRYYGNRYGYGNGYGYGNQEPDDDDGGYGWNQPSYGYRQPSYGYNNPRSNWNGAGMVNPRHPGLVWACDSQGHHCHWARRYGSNSGLNPFALNGLGNNYGNNGNGYYGGNNGYYGNSMGGLGSLLGPLFGGQQP